MEPTIHTGDVVVVERIPAASVRVGDVVTFRDPDGSGRLITHRVRSVERRNGSIRIVTKGDAANGVQRWTTPAEGSLGRVRFRLWKLGYLLVKAQTPFVHLLLVLGPALALAATALNRIWRRQPRRRPDAA
jgi:signal peptidase